MIVRQSLATLKGSIVALALAVACGSGNDGAVATVDDKTFTVDDVVEYMQQAGHGANREAVERAVDELVKMYLVTQRARERYTLTASDSLRLTEMRETLMWNQFREDVIHKNVTVDEEELRTWYDENVGEEVDARHILVRAQASDPDSVRQAAKAKAESLLEEVKAGADFASLAEENSDDPGSAQRGGSLGYFSRGQMVGPFEEAAFGTAVGEVASDIVETQFGYHVIKVEDRRKQTFEELREEIEEQLARPGRQEAEQAFLTGLMETSSIEFYESNIDQLIALIENPPPGEVESELLDLQLATFTAGEVNLGDIWKLYEMLPEANRRTIATLDQTTMIQALSSIIQRRLVLARATAEGTVLDSTRQGQLDERIDLLWAQSYLGQLLEKRTEVADADVRQYFDEHREFYRGQTFEDVREQVRSVLIGQRRDQFRDPEYQRELMSAVADSQAEKASLQTNEALYERILATLKERLAEGDTGASS